MTTAQEVRISAGIFIGIINEDGNGPYQLILKEAARRAGVNISEKVYPLKRALKTFTDRKALAIYGMTDAVIRLEFTNSSSLPGRGKHPFPITRSLRGSP